MLTGQFCKIPLDGGKQTFVPFVRASVVYAGRVSVEMDALIDTGASINLISISSVKTLFGISPDEARKGIKQSVSGIGSNQVFAYGFQADISLRASTNATHNPFILANSWVYVSDSALPPKWQILIGQHHGFEERTLIHSNRGKNRYWQIRV